MEKNKDKQPQFMFLQVKSIDIENRTIDAVASAAELDRDNDIILTDAFKETINYFKANPVILACHQHKLSSGSSPVIGSAVPESISIGEKDVNFKMKFADTALGNEYWTLYRDGHMRAFSIGFIPLQWRDEKDETRGYIRIYTKIELLEISAVPVPSNRAALARAKEIFGANDKDIFAELSEIFNARLEAIENQFKGFESTISSLDKKITEEFEELKSLVIPDPDELAKALLGEPDTSESAGGQDKSEQLVDVLQKAINNI